MEGSRFKHFKVGRLLGRGGMGEVYLAEDTTLERQVALKVLPRDLMGDPGAQGRLLDEARSCSRVQHPNIATVYAIEEDGGRFALVMEYVEGRTLREIIARKSLSLGRVTRIGRAIAEGLIAAHDQSIVHRDLKPANVMLTDRGEVKIMDFGLAFRPERVVHTVGNKAYGTVNYMSPEQARGDTPTAASDIFSYGVLLYELLTGDCPFQADNDLAVLHLIVSGEPKSLRELRRDVPPALEALVRKCMEKDPAQRYASMREVADELSYAEPNLDHGPKDLISELTKGLSPQPTPTPSSSVQRRGSHGHPDDGLPQMAPDLRVPISDILAALDEQPAPPSRAPFDQVPEGFILAPTSKDRKPIDPRIAEGVVLQDARVSALPENVRVHPRPSAREQAAARASSRKPRPRPVDDASREVFLGEDTGSQSITSSMPVRIQRAPHNSPWTVSLGLLLAILIAVVGFLGLLHAAGVKNLPGHAIFDKLSASSANDQGSDAALDGVQPMLIEPELPPQDVDASSQAPASLSASDSTATEAP